MKKIDRLHAGIISSCCIMSIIQDCYGKEGYLDLFAEAKKDFDHLTYQDVTCLRVVNSIRCKGNSMLCFQIHKDSFIPEGWRANSNIDELKH